MCIGSRAPHCRTVLQIGLDKPSKTSPKKQPTLERDQLNVTLISTLSYYLRQHCVTNTWSITLFMVPIHAGICWTSSNIQAISQTYGIWATDRAVSGNFEAGLQSKLCPPATWLSSNGGFDPKFVRRNLPCWYIQTLYLWTNWLISWQPINYQSFITKCFNLEFRWRHRFIPNQPHLIIYILNI